MRNLILAAVAGLAITTAPAIAADASHGKVLFEKCASCHNDKAGASDVGPSLNGVLGRKAGGLDDFRYSNAMRRTDFTWDEANLKEYILNPQGKVKGNRMPFSGFSNPTDVDDIVAFLSTLK
jgi:cytochrome c